MGNNNSGAGTVLIAIALLLIVGAAAWFLIESADENETSFEVDTSLPVGGGV